MKVADILALKGSVVFAIKPSETIGTLSQLLRDRRIGAAIVSSDGKAVDGVISERDIAYGPLDPQGRFANSAGFGTHDRDRDHVLSQ